MAHRLRRAAEWSTIFAVMAAILLLLDRIPGCVASYRGQVPRPYASLSEVEGALGVRLGFPYFFPDRLEWPPDVLLARRRPLQVYAEVRERGQPRDAPPTLVIREWTGLEQHFRLAPAIAPATSGRLELDNGLAADWVFGHDASGRPWYQARVQRGALTTEIDARLEWKELRMMVESLSP